jgi:hypothetical protein
MGADEAVNFAHLVVEANEKDPGSRHDTDRYKWRLRVKLSTGQYLSVFHGFDREFVGTIGYTRLGHAAEGCTGDYSSVEPRHAANRLRRYALEGVPYDELLEAARLILAAADLTRE